MRNEIKAVLSRLKEIKNRVELYKKQAEDSGHEARIEELENEIDSINTAIEALDEID